MSKFKVPALVIGSDINGLGVARSLAHVRIPVWMLDDNDHRPEMRTHAARCMKIRALNGEVLVEDLVRLAEENFHGLRPVLFLTQEESVRTVSHARDRLSGMYRFCLPPIPLVDKLQHKHGFQKLAEQLDCPIPPLLHVRSPKDLPRLECLNYPVVIKPGERHAAYGKKFKKAYRVESVSEADELVRRILSVIADIVVQEWTEGPDSNIYFCLQYLNKNGRVMASFTGRKVRSWPPQVGGTASCVPAPGAHSDLVAMTTRFFQGAGVIGMAGMEYKRDARTGEFRMVEPTIGRTDYQSELAALNGINLPHAAYCAELDVPWSSPEGMKKRLAWRVRSIDMRSAVAQHQSPKQGFDGVDGIRDALWRWSDPMPSIVHGMHRVNSSLRSRTATLISGMRLCRSKP